MKRFSFQFFFFLFFTSVCSAQTKDSVPVLENDTMRVSIFKGIEKFYRYRHDSVNMMRSLDSLVIYNPVIRRYNYNTSLGNVGSSVFSPFYCADFSLGLRAGTESRRMFLWQSSDLRFVNSHKRYTRVNYVNGSKKENYMEVEHSQSFGKFMDVGFQYNRINSLGYYTWQQTYLSRLNIYGRLSSRDGRYLLLFNTALNSNKNQENGGITADSLFEDDLVSNVKFIPVNLNGAQSQMKDNSFMVHQHVDFGRGVHSPQSIDDSLKSEKVFVPKFRIGHEVSYRNYFFLYSDGSPASGYYTDVFLDSAATNDSIGARNIENILSLTFFHKQKNYLSISVRHQYAEVKYGGNIPDTADGSVFIQTNWFNTNNVFVQGNAGLYSKAIDYSWLEAAYCATGYNAGDYSFSGGLQIRFSKGGITNPAKHPGLEVKASVASKEPDYIFQRYVSNNFMWSNNFGKVFNAEVQGVFAAPVWKLRAGAGYNLVNNPVYYAQDAKAAQYGGAVSILKAFVQKRFTVGKFNLDNDVTYQYVKDYMPVRLPAVVLRSSLFFEGYLFKKALHSRFGVDVYYNTAWNAYNYMPATGQFYLQDGKRYGNYPYIDVYAAFRVKGARFFFKLDHAFAGLLGNTYYGAAHYPLNGRTFKFGVDWVFLD